MHNFISEFKDLDIIESNEISTKVLFNTQNYYFELVFPQNIYEWFVTMYDNNTEEEVWNNWSEWYTSGDVTKDNIDNFYKEDIKYFISRLQSSTEFKIIKKPKMLQGKINNTWKAIDVGELKN
jgi:hypothetical protein